jgi:hypothetical protein
MIELKQTKLNLNLLLILCPFMTSLSQVGAIVSGAQMGDSIHTVIEGLSDLSVTHKLITVESPSFPLAKNTESHLICTRVQTAKGVIDRVVLTFADEVLVHIECRGNTKKALIESRTDTAFNYLDFEIYLSDLVFAHTKKDLVTILSKESLHPNLFAWENPYPLSPKNPAKKYQSSAKVPSFLKMGGDIAKLASKFESNSKYFLRDALDGSDPDADTQLNVFGIEYAGFPRKFESAIW